MRNFYFLLAISIGIATKAEAVEFVTDASVFEGMQAPLTILDFEGIAPDKSYAWNISGDIGPHVYFEGLRFNVLAGNFKNPNYPGTSPSDFLLHDFIDRGFAMNFAQGIDRIGMRIALARIDPDASSLIELRLLKGSDLIDSRQVLVNHVGIFNSFIGYSGLAGVTRFEIDIVQSQTFAVAIDDLRFQVIPEPATLGLLTFGVAATPFFRRRRKR